MEAGKKRENFFLKTWQSIGGGLNKSPSKPSKTLSKSKSRHHNSPEGCFGVYVGQERQRFVIKTKCLNHPLFKLLLEDAEMEYGYNCEGPLLIPCEVDLFYKVLAEVERKEIEPISCGLGYGSCSPFNSARRLGRSDMARGLGSYGLLTPSSLLEMNQ